MNTLEIIKRPVLAKSQIKIYDLICDCIKKDKTLNYEDVVNIYINHSCQNTRDGKPGFLCWCPNKPTVWREQNKQSLNMNVMAFLQRSIGVLVMTGRLKIIPIFDWESNKEVRNGQRDYKKSEKDFVG